MFKKGGGVEESFDSSHRCIHRFEAAESFRISVRCVEVTPRAGQSSHWLYLDQT
jgi:hypothetical protein